MLILGSNFAKRLDCGDFSAAVLAIKARDKRIGWSPRQRTRRLHSVANTSRFLVLAERAQYSKLGFARPELVSQGSQCRLPLERTFITADALRCQQKSARFITQELGSHDIFGLKGNQSGILERAQLKLPKDFFPSENDSGWSKAHGRLERWRLSRVELNPERAGLCGCWQFIALGRERQKARRSKVVECSREYSYYASSSAKAEPSAGERAGKMKSPLLQS